MLNDLYREIILDHYQNPRNYGPLPQATITIRGNNPVCGDEVTVSLRLRDGVIDEARFSGMG
ncbi:MAG: iron-sulfur cluster assembly scaffold protein, partial [Dehalococcoidia bacterium]|nr:iron-sulfur cluster assembly scaffold protein [Dehalococcoidia bacterium]